VVRKPLPSGTAEYDLEQQSEKVVRRRFKTNVRSWLCAQERWHPEVVNMFGATARYRRAAVCSSHDDARPDISALYSGKIYFFPPHISRFALLLLRQRRGAAAANWTQRSSTCDAQRAGPRATAWAPSTAKFLRAAAGIGLGITIN
jgi:hypothetical protein